MHPIVILFVVDLVLVAPLASWLANEKGRSPTAWLLVTAILGPLALLAVGLAPPRWVVDDRRATATSPDSMTPDPRPARDAKAAPIPNHERDDAAQAPESTSPAIPTESSEDSDEADSVAQLTSKTGIENVAIGVFAGGISELGAGYRYLISVSRRSLLVSGPVNVAPGKVVFRAPRNSVDVTAVGSDVVIIVDHPSGRHRRLAFRGIAESGIKRITELLEGDRQPVRRVSESEAPAG